MAKLISLLLGCLTSTLVFAKSITPVFDERPWELGWSANQQGTIFEEYVLKGESVHHYSELVTIQFQPGVYDAMALEKFEKMTKATILNVCPTTSWETLDAKPNQRIWQFIVKNCPGQPNQHEIARALVKQDGLYTFHYLTKKPFSADSQASWRNKLQQIKVD